MSSNKIVIFYHMYQINNWQDIFKEHLELLNNSGLIDNIEFVHLGINGEYVYNGDNKKISCVINKDQHLEEGSTLKSLYSFANENPGYKILYIHSKGVTNNSKPVEDWRNYMNYFMIEKWKECVKYLEHYDSVGCNLSKEHSYGNYPHYSGNFWWANADYINKLNYSYLDDSFRFMREFWIGSGNGKMYEIHNSNVNHYKERYLNSEYRK
jgi:hypothetical protein